MSSLPAEGRVMLHILGGKNSFLRTQRLEQLIDESGLSAERLEIDNLSAKQWRLELSKQDLFANRRLIIVKNLSKNADLRDTTIDLIDQLMADENLILIDDEEEIDLRTKFVRAARAAKVLTLFDLPRESDQSAAKKFIIDQAKQQKLQLTKQQAGLIWQRVGPDPWAQAEAVRKLALLGQEVTSDEIETYIDQRSEVAVFKIFDYIWLGNVEVLLAELDKLRQTDEVPQKFFGLISSQIINLATVKAAASPEQAQLDLGLPPFVVGNLRRQANQASWGQIKQFINQLVDIDQQIKSSKAEPWELISVGLYQLTTELEK